MKQVICFLILVMAATIQVWAQDSAIFPLGEKAKNINHTGDVWLRELQPADSIVNTQVAVAVFAPNAKLNWHSHSAGQILIITDGIGFYQEKGMPVQVVRKGDVVKCAPNVVHWHGASHKVGVTYLAVSPKSKTTWLQPVTEAAYNSIEIPVK